MAKGFVHVNGVTYELAYPVDDIGRVASQLQGQGSHRLDVRLGGEQVSLHLDLGLVWTSAAWVSSEGTQVFAS